MNLEAASPIVLSAATLVTGQGVLKGITIRETAGAAATVRLFDNTAASGTLLGTYGLAALGSIDIGLMNRRISKGVTAAVTGTVEGSIFV